MDLSRFPRQSGVYALLLEMKQDASLKVGRLGSFPFAAGYYVYLGSAHGPGGLRGRLKHHLSAVKSPHWHLDWLRQAASVKTIVYALSDISHECAWSQEIGRLARVSVPVPGFGSSDCRHACAAHLYYFSEADRWPEIPLILAKIEADQEIIWVD
jgi:Uri superfamily endonuclease